MPNHPLRPRSKAPQESTEERAVAETMGEALLKAYGHRHGNVLDSEPPGTVYTLP